MFAAPNIRDVEAQQAAQQQTHGATAGYPMQGGMMQGGMQGDQKVVMSTTTTHYNTNPASQGQNVSQNQMQHQQQLNATGQGAAAGSMAPKSSIGRAAHAMEWGSFMLIVAFFSLVLMIAAAQICDVNMPNGSCVATRGYQVSVGIISLFVSFIVGVLHHAGRLDSVPARTAISAFLFLWWVAAVIVLTFIGDFQATTRASGYFSTWLAFAFSALSFIAVSEGLEYGLDKTLQSVRKPLFFLVLASLVCMGAAIAPCSPRSACVGYNAYAVVVSVISLCIALFLFFFPARIERKGMKIVAWFLVLWWVFGASIMTLGGPFLVAGNGFFASYSALVASIVFLAVLSRNT